MEYDFSQFLKDSQEQCKSRDEFSKRISKEIEMVIEMPGDQLFLLEKQAYIKRLEGADFAAEYDILKEPDKYDEKLMILLESLS